MKRLKIKLYKYTSHLDQFLDFPSVKVTPSNELNDPFELKYSQVILNDAKSNFDPGYIHEDIESFLEIRNSDVGVVSFSETKSNILMWSHYSDDHKGVVIEFTVDVVIDDSKKYPNLFKNRARNQYEFDRVKYRLERDIDKLSNSGSRVLTSEYRNHVSFIKADCWSYEKEYRFLCGLQHSDRCLINIEKICDSQLNRIKDNLDELSIKYELLHNSVLLNVRSLFSDEDNIFKYLMLRGYLEEEVESANLLYFYEVKPETVTGLFFGAKVERKQIKNTLENPNLVKFGNLIGHIERAEISKSRYELVFQPIE